MAPTNVCHCIIWCVEHRVVVQRQWWLWRLKKCDTAKYFWGKKEKPQYDQDEWLVSQFFWCIILVIWPSQQKRIEVRDHTNWVLIKCYSNLSISASVILLLDWNVLFSLERSPTESIEYPGVVSISKHGLPAGLSSAEVKFDLGFYM